MVWTLQGAVTRTLLAQCAEAMAADIGKCSNPTVEVLDDDLFAGDQRQNVVIVSRAVERRRGGSGTSCSGGRSEAIREIEGPEMGKQALISPADSSPRFNSCKI